MTPFMDVDQHGQHEQKLDDVIPGEIEEGIHKGVFR
jgi:hypothetical protein